MCVYCSAFGCKEKYDKGSMISFHRFPKDPVRRKLWEEKLLIKDFKSSDTSSLCSKHFTPDCFDKERFGPRWLKQDAVPTIFNFPSHLQEIILQHLTQKTAINEVITASTSSANNGHPPQKKLGYLGDFNESDMISSSEAQKAFNIAVEVLRKKTSLIDYLRQKQKRSRNKISRYEKMLNHVKKKAYICESAKNSLKLQTDSIGEDGSRSKSEKIDLSLQQNTLLKPEVEQERVTPDDGMKCFESSNLNLAVAVEETILPDLPEESCSLSIEPSTSIVIKEEIIEIEDDESTYLTDSSNIPFMPTSPEESGALYSHSVTTHSSEPPLKRAKVVTTDSLEPSEISPLTEQKVTPMQSAIRLRGQTTLDSQTKTMNSKEAMELDSSSEIGGEKEMFSKEATISPRDELDAYGEYIVSKLRPMDPKSRAFVQKVIGEAIVKVETGRYSSEELNSHT